MIHYRTFRNTDPPGLVHVWNECFTGRGATLLTANILLEYFAFAKPYFDPAGLTLAVDGDRTVGFCLAGFGPSPGGDAISQQTGIICSLAVLPEYRRQGVGAALLERSEAYLRERGATELLAGAQSPLNPYTFALYGGSDSPGFLESDRGAGAFLEKHGYKRQRTCLVLQRSLERPFTISDPRFLDHRNRYDIHAGPQHGSSWFRECVLGPIEMHEYRLIEKATSKVVGRAAVWEMETYRPRWNEHSIGLTELEVLPDLRRQGLAKFLVSQALRHLHEQFFTLVEAQIPANNTAALALYKGLGFAQVDAGHRYRRD